MEVILLFLFTLKNNQYCSTKTLYERDTWKIQKHYFAQRNWLGEENPMTIYVWLKPEKSQSLLTANSSSSSSHVSLLSPLVDFCPSQDEEELLYQSSFSTITSSDQWVGPSVIRKLRKLVFFLTDHFTAEWPRYREGWQHELVILIIYLELELLCWMCNFSLEFSIIPPETILWFSQWSKKQEKQTLTVCLNYW